MSVCFFALDDERPSLAGLTAAIHEAAPLAQVRAFQRWHEAIDEIEKNGCRPQAAFLDIEMPEASGLQIAKRIKDASPETNIIFVTGYSSYAIEAMKLYPSGYMLKPATAEKVRTELENLRHPIPQLNSSAKLRVQCFGNFEVYCHNEPLRFKRSRTKEFFAYLVSRNGEFCTIGDIVTILWLDEPDSQKHRSYVRQLSHDLTNSLKAVGAEGVLLKQYGLWAVRTELLDCDYYRMLRGDVNAINSYCGEFISQFSWAEITAGLLSRL